MVKRAIVADDSPTWRQIYTSLITSHFPDVNVDQVASGSELVDRVLSEDYCLVISDNDMEGQGGGLRALKRVREAGNQIPFYVISSGNIRTQALGLGANGSYSKDSFNSHTFLGDMAKYLK